MYGQDWLIFFILIAAAGYAVSCYDLGERVPLRAVFFALAGLSAATAAFFFRQDSTLAGVLFTVAALLQAWMASTGLFRFDRLQAHLRDRGLL